VAFRESINKQQTTAVVIAVAALAGAFMLFFSEYSGRKLNIPVLSQLYYTDDDGATYYPDSINLVPPYSHNGKKAVRAYVFRCGEGGIFVGYLEAFTPQAKEAKEASLANHDNPPIASDFGRMLKLPLTGDKGWQNSGTPGFLKIMQVHCPNGGDDSNIEAVFPR
jgi:hypothetical protein